MKMRSILFSTILGASLAVTPLHAATTEENRLTVATESAVSMTTVIFVGVALLWPNDAY